MALYPPLLEAYQPAFSYKQASLRLYFKPPNTVDMSNVKHLCIKMTYQSNNSIVPLKDSQIDGLYYYMPLNGWVNENNSNTYYVDICPADGWKKDAYYKVQMRFGASAVSWKNDSEYLDWRKIQVETRGFSEWSTVMVLKAIEIPKVEIINQKKDLAMYLLNLSAHYTELTLTPQFYGQYELTEPDSDEPLDKYRFELYKVDEEKGDILVEDSGWQQYYSDIQDNTSRTSTNIWRFKTGLQEGTSVEPIYYKVIYSIKTSNYYEAKSEPYLFNIDTSYLNKMDEMQVSAIPNPEEGCIDIYTTDISPFENPTGNFVITRTDERSNFQSWQDLHYFIKNGSDNGIYCATKEFSDYTIESGLKYKYKVWTINSKGQRTRYAEMGLSVGFSDFKIINSTGNENEYLIINHQETGLNPGKYRAVYSANKWSYKILNSDNNNFIYYLSNEDFGKITGIKINDAYLNEAAITIEFTTKKMDKENQDYISVDFEHSYLYCDDIQLKLEYNLKLSSFKRTTLVNKQDTLGSKYPTVMKNAYTDYAEFPISGLISIHMDDARSFLKEKYFYNDNSNTEEYLGLYYKDELVVPPDRYYPVESRRTASPSAVAANKASIPFGITSDTVFIERMFREKVIEFLNDGGYKLYKSPTEGNFIIVLTNVSFTPNPTLGRMLFDFSATAYEVAENTLDNLATYGLINVGEFNSSILKIEDKFFGQARLEDFYEIYEEEWEYYTDKNTNADEKDKIGIIKGYNKPPKIEYKGNVIKSIMNIEETTVEDDYRFNLDNIYSLNIEPYPITDLDGQINELENQLKDLKAAASEEKNSPLVVEYLNQKTNETAKKLCRLIAKLERFKTEWVYNKPITLTINGQKILVGPTPKKYVYRGNLTKVDNVHINIPALVNYTCGKSVVEDASFVVVSSFIGEDWGQIVFVPGDKELGGTNVYERIVKSLEQQIINAISQINGSTIVFDTLVDEDDTGKHDFWRTDESKKWRYQVKDFVWLRFEGLPGTVIYLENIDKNNELSKTKVVIGPTGIYNLRDYGGNTNFNFSKIWFEVEEEPKAPVIIDYRLKMSIKEMSEA